jgi:hypothetical protein
VAGEAVAGDWLDLSRDMRLRCAATNSATSKPTPPTRDPASRFIAHPPPALSDSARAAASFAATASLGFASTPESLVAQSVGRAGHSAHAPPSLAVPATTLAIHAA